jgi:hypothetical protein
MKRLTLIFSLIVLTGLLGGCITIDYGSPYRTIDASGQKEERSYDVESFDTFELKGRMSNLHVYLSQGNTAVRIDADQAYLDHIDVQSSGNMLSVSTDYGMNNRVDLYISTPDLKKIDCIGAASFACEDALAGDSLVMDITGAASGTLDLNYALLDMRIAGAADVTLNGATDEMVVSSAGACNIDGRDLTTQTCRIDLAGAGAIKIRCEEELDATIGGFGTIDYWGAASVSRNSAGIGKITYKGE